MRERSRPACSSTDEAARQGKQHQYSRTNLTIHLSNVDTGARKPSSKPATANFNQKQGSFHRPRAANAPARSSSTWNRKQRENAEYESQDYDSQHAAAGRDLGQNMRLMDRHETRMRRSYERAHLGGKHARTDGAPQDRSELLSMPHGHGPHRIRPRELRFRR